MFQDLLVLLDHKDFVVLVEPLGCQDPRDRSARQELPDRKDREVIQVSVVHKVPPVP